MAYSAITNGEIDLDSLITVSTMTKIRDNPEAIALGLANATRIVTAALTDSLVTTAKIADDSVTSAKIPDDAIDADQIAENAVGGLEIDFGAVNYLHMGAGSVRQAALDTSMPGEVSKASTAGMVTLPGGTYGFYPQTRVSAGLGGNFSWLIVCYLQAIQRKYI